MAYIATIAVLIVLAQLTASAVERDVNNHTWPNPKDAKRWRRLSRWFGLYTVPFYLIARIGIPKHTPEPRTPPPGWYDDPHIPGTQRWWDGVTWTNQTKP